MMILCPLTFKISSELFQPSIKYLFQLWLTTLDRCQSVESIWIPFTAICNVLWKVLSALKLDTEDVW